MRYAVIGCNANEAYSFFLPMVAALWHRLDHTLLAILVDEPAWSTSAHQLELAHLRSAGARIAWAPAHPRERTATVAQVTRLFAALLPGVASTDQLLTTDVDTWPLGTWIGNASGELQLYNANLYPPDPLWPTPAHFPMCYVSGAAAVWRELMGGTDFEAALRAALDSCQAGKPPSVDPHVWAWCLDERILSERVTRWSGYPDRCALITRDWQRHGERHVDRYRFEVPADLVGFADAHLRRPGFTEEHWPALRALLALALGESAAAHWDAYRDAYLSLRDR